jgi:hypothetical protein
MVLSVYNERTGELNVEGSENADHAAMGAAVIFPLGKRYLLSLGGCRIGIDHDAIPFLQRQIDFDIDFAGSTRIGQPGTDVQAIPLEHVTLRDFEICSRTAQRDNGI